MAVQPRRVRVLHAGRWPARSFPGCRRRPSPRAPACCSTLAHEADDRGERARRSRRAARRSAAARARSPLSSIAMPSILVPPRSMPMRMRAYYLAASAKTRSGMQSVSVARYRGFQLRSPMAPRDVARRVVLLCCRGDSRASAPRRPPATPTRGRRQDLSRQRQRDAAAGSASRRARPAGSSRPTSPTTPKRSTRGRTRSSSTRSRGSRRRRRSSTRSRCRADQRRQLNLLKLSLVLVTPADPKEAEELTKIAGAAAMRPTARASGAPTRRSPTPA